MAFFHLSARAEPLDKNKVRTLLLKGHNAWKNKDRATALDYMDQAIQLDSQSPILYFVRGEMCAEMGDHRNAINNWRSASLYMRMKGDTAKAQTISAKADKLEAALTAVTKQAQPPKSIAKVAPATLQNNQSRGTSSLTLKNSTKSKAISSAPQPKSN